MSINILSEFESVVESGSVEEFLLRQIDAERLPSHIAIIMDGNGRWAARRNQPRVAGHRAGAEAVRATVEAAARLGISHLTLYAFSTENWKRPRLEVEALMGLLRDVELPMPARLTITLQSGEVLHREVPVETWLAGARTADVVVTAGSAVRRVEIDAEHAFPDLNRVNNIWEAP